MKKELIVGKLNYLNTIIFYIELESVLNDIKYTDGTPSMLNKMLRNGEIDLSPSSSIEFAMRPRTYLVLPDLSISSYGEVKSVLLFSKYPLSELNYKKISVTSSSATSYTLIRIILESFLSLKKVEYLTSSAPPAYALRTSDAVLLIGDEALISTKKLKADYVYDLGKLWYDLTGLPFVFALWIARRDSYNQNRERFKQIYNVLLSAKKRFLKDKNYFFNGLPQLKVIDRAQILDYWETINYNLTDEHIKSINKFYELAAQIGIIPRAPLLALADL
jgi:chorismate dehydratase